MGLLSRVPAFAALLAVCVHAQAADWQLSVDARAVSSDGQTSFLNGGYGKLRYDEAHDGLRLGRLRIAVAEPIGESFELRADASNWGDRDKNLLDLTEAFVEYRPVPKSAWRLRARAGAFYAPISLENRTAGWESPYTLSSSAINTWIGEELRTIGVEGQLEWMGDKIGGRSNIALVGALYGWNDPAGVLVARHGLSLHDRQTSLFGRVGRPQQLPVDGRVLFDEIDHRAGYYVGAKWRLLDRIEARVLHYDNRADPSRFDPSIGDFAWKTTFDAAGIRFDGTDGWTLMTQWLNGTTDAVPDVVLRWRFDSTFGLISKSFGAHRLSARYDRFDSHMSGDDDADKGHAVTAAYFFEPNDRWRFAIEWLRILSAVDGRTYLGLANIAATETQFELSLRYSWTGSF
jgi:hypothetical protein